MTGSEEHPTDETSVLASLPATRPQRRSPKRAAAKPDGTPPAEPTPASTPRPRAPRTRRRPAVAPGPSRPTPTPVSEVGTSSGGQPGDEQARRRAEHDPAPPPVAAQGFEAEPIHGSVNPPTGAELLASVAQGATELAELGLGLTRRLARALLDRLPGL